MIRWQRLSVDVRCGLCGTEIGKSHPVKVLHNPAVNRPMYRGECCEGQAPAVVLPFAPDPPRRVAGLSFATFRQTVPEMFDRIESDHKMSQAGRDPGEDDD